MDWMAFHLFVASAVYAVAFMFAFIWIWVMCARLSNRHYRALLKRKIARFIRNILRKFVKT
jgi:hypothetical protein